MSKKTLISAIAAVPAILSAIFAATHDFIPDFVFRGSSLADWHTLGHANWRAENGEIAANPETADGGWLVLDKSYQDVEFYTEFRCAENATPVSCCEPRRHRKAGGREFMYPFRAKAAPMT
jgi:hypothetical protein